MPTLTNAEDLLEAHRRVGAYVCGFNFLEAKVGDALAVALKLEPLQAAIINANISMRDKLKILRTLCDLEVMLSAQSEDFDKALQRISTISTKDRNTVVHYPSGPDRNGGVRFLRVQANQKLRFPKIVWKPKNSTQRSKNWPPSLAPWIGSPTPSGRFNGGRDKIRTCDPYDVNVVL
jgi:hypothetical protein